MTPVNDPEPEGSEAQLRSQTFGTFLRELLLTPMISIVANASARHDLRSSAEAGPYRGEPSDCRWLSRRRRDMIAYLAEENRSYRRSSWAIGGCRMIKRHRLAVRGHRLGRAALRQVAGTVTPDTILQWRRQFIVRTGLAMIGTTFGFLDVCRRVVSLPMPYARATVALNREG